MVARNSAVRDTHQTSPHPHTRCRTDSNATGPALLSASASGPADNPAHGTGRFARQLDRPTRHGLRLRPEPADHCLTAPADSPPPRHRYVNAAAASCPGNVPATMWESRVPSSDRDRGAGESFVASCRGVSVVRASRSLRAFGGAIEVTRLWRSTGRLDCGVVRTTRGRVVCGVMAAS